MGVGKKMQQGTMKRQEPNIKYKQALEFKRKRRKRQRRRPAVFLGIEI